MHLVGSYTYCRMMHGTYSVKFVGGIYSEYFVSSLFGLFREFRNKAQSFLGTPSSNLIIGMFVGGLCCVLRASCLSAS